MSVITQLEREIENTQVLIFAGGKAKRMGYIEKPKPLLEVCGKTLLDLCIEYYKNNGFKEYVVLVGHKHNEIMEHLGSGDRHGVNIQYSIDPPVEKIGKGKALKHAIETGVVDKHRRALIAFPDDIFLEPTLPLKLLIHHLEGVRTRNTLATTVLAAAVDYPYGVAKVDENNLVVSFTEKPVIRMYTSTGLYMFEPKVYDLILDMIDINADKALEFEQIVLPELAKRKRIYALIIPKGMWLPVNTLKELERAETILSEKSLFSTL
ncbi:MAG: hypothetical protein DRJ44_03435 [Thermoprotei archaeon]|nr:MAG: hypothetical protein DRJ44_03435 [Thermoprotei archaeon]